MKYLNVFLIVILSVINYITRTNLLFLIMPLFSLFVYYYGKKRFNTILIIWIYSFIIFSTILAFNVNLTGELTRYYFEDIWAIVIIPVLSILLIMNFPLSVIKNILKLPQIIIQISFSLYNKLLIKNSTTSYDRNTTTNDHKMKKVFISYNHSDKDFVLNLKRRLEEEDIPITIDIEKMKFGDNIQEFINRAVRDTDFTISIISQHSLKSAWVIIESLETMIYEKVEKKKKIIPVFIDDSFLQDDFQSKLIEGIEESVRLLHSEITKLTKKYIPTTNLDNKKSKLLDLRHNIDKILNKINSSLAADFSNDEKIEENLPKLINDILSSID